MPREQSPRRARVLLADDHELAREALRSILSTAPDFEVVGEATDGSQAVTLARRLHPEIVIMDVRMPGSDGLAATREITRTLPATRVVLLSSYEQRTYVLEALRAGAVGYLLKGATKQDLLAALRRALSGQRSVAPDLAARLLHDEATGARSSTLTAREVDVLQLIARGHTNEQIGQDLLVSVNTVKTHITHLLQKLNAPDRAAAVARAAQLGLLDEPLSVPNADRNSSAEKPAHHPIG